jgi:hypothetical protein
MPITPIAVEGLGNHVLTLAQHSPNYTVAQEEALGGVPSVVDGQPGMSYTSTCSSGLLGPASRALNASDLTLINAATDSLIQQTSNGLSIMVSGNDSALAGAQNFANAIAALRESIGENQTITPLMIISAVKQSNANNASIPQSYVANAIGYLNGIR